MLFKEDTNINNADALLNVIDVNCNKAAKMREDIRKMKKCSSKKDTKLTEEPDGEEVFFEEDYVAKEKAFNFDYYLELYKTLGDNFTKGDLLEILPDVDDYYFKNIIIRLQAEVVKEVKEIYEVINEEKANLSLEELADLEETLKLEEEKKKTLEGLLSIEDTRVENAVVNNTNKLILVPTANGNIKLIDEIKKIPIEYYHSFIELFNSIVDGSFKNFRRFVSNDCLVGMCEVRGFKTRVIFSRLEGDCYALISAFIKKVDNSTGYREYLINRFSEYRAIEATLKDKVSDEEFMRQNDFFVQELYNILENKDKSKTYKYYKRNDLDD